MTNAIKKSQQSQLELVTPKKKLTQIDRDRLRRKKEREARDERIQKKVLALVHGLEGFSGGELDKIQASKSVYSFNNVLLDAATGVTDPVYGNGGVREGSVVELFGPEGAFKSGTLEQLIISVQRRGKIAVLLASEEPNFARMKRIGIDIHKLIVLPCYAPLKKEAKYQLAELRMKQLAQASKDDDVALIAIDSVKALVSAGQIYKKGKIEAAKDRDFSESETAVRANLMEKLFNRLKIFNKRAIVVLVNHSSVKIGADYTMGVDLRPSTPGGRRIRYECDLRIEIASRAIYEKFEHELFDVENQLGIRPFWYVIKNKYSNLTGARRVSSDFYFETGKFDDAKDILRAGINLGLIKRSGGWFTFIVRDRERRVQGEEKAKAFLEKRPKLLRWYWKQIIDQSELLFKTKKKEKKKAGAVLGAGAFDEDEDDEKNSANFESDNKKDKGKKRVC